MDDGSDALDAAKALVAGARRVVALTGAGISTDSGIPDYRGPKGLWTTAGADRRPPSLEAYLASAEVRERVWRMRAEHPAWQAEPNAGHLALVALERAGRLAALLTQNIDGLHQRAGSTRVLELHGTMTRSKCTGCAEQLPMARALARVADGEPDPPCRRCGEVLGSATVSFGQPLDRGVLTAARAEATSADLMLAVGSSLTVQPAAGLVGLAAKAGAVVVVCNDSPTPYDGLATVVLRDRIGTVLPALAEAVTSGVGGTDSLRSG